MPTLPIPVLRGDDPLGFLAAIGLLSLSEQQVLRPLRLAWEGRVSPVAIVETNATSVSEVASGIRSAFDQLVEARAALPGVDPEFPVPANGETKDPMRMSRDAMARWFDRADTEWRDAGNPWLARWLLGLAAQAAVKDAKRGDVQLTQFYAPTGQMKLRRSIFDMTVEAVRSVDGPEDALTTWRRTSFAGANFDDRAVRDAGVTTTGEPDNQGAPSPTWLAAMAMRFFPVVDDGHQALTVGWQRASLYPGFTTRTLVWPVWEPLLEPAAVRALLAHPGLELIGPPENRRPRGSRQLAALGMRAVFGASRRTLSQGDGPLGPARCLWMADE